MSLGRAAGPILATICGVCTAYAAFAPELQKQAAERPFKDQHDTSPSSSSNPSPSSPSPSSSSSPAAAPQNAQLQQQPTIISNDQSLGNKVRHTVQEVKSEVAAAEPGAAWFGLGAWAGVLGGGASSAKESADGDKNS